MKYICFVMCFLLSIPIGTFCADKAPSAHYVGKDGMIIIKFNPWYANDLPRMALLCGLIIDNQANAQAKQIYAKDLLKITPMLNSVFLLITSVAERNPECAEQMVYE